VEVTESLLKFQIDSPTSSFAKREQLKIYVDESSAFTSQGAKPSILEESTVRVRLNQKSMDEKDCPEKTDIAKKTIFAEIASITNSTIGTYQMLSADKLTCLTDFDYSVKYLGPDAKAPEMIKFNGKTR